MTYQRYKSLYLSRASIRTLGFRTAKIMASRGALEGNNALLKVDDYLYYFCSINSI
jgi:hypothetical protein